MNDQQWPPPNVDWYYVDQSCAIANADCREILPLLPKVDLVLTDPPYGIGFAAQPTKWQRLAGQAAENWDSTTPEDWVFGYLRDMSRWQIIWGGNYFPLPAARGWLAWTKPDAPPSMGDVEFAWTNLDRTAKHIDHSIAATNSERVGHPTQKPLKVIRWALSLAPADCQTILDPYLGSGTTLRAAKDLGRRAIGIEINRDYCDIAVQRLRQEVFAL